MTWHTSHDVAAFWTATATHLASDPLTHNVLLTETAYLLAQAADGDRGFYGWWQHDEGPVQGAFLQAPRHRPVLSLATHRALIELAEHVTGLAPFNVDRRSADAARDIWWHHCGVELVKGPRIRSYVLGVRGLRAEQRISGRPRTATTSDRDLLARWYGGLLAALPDDSTDLAFLVDDPIAHGRATLWEVDGTPVGVAVRSRPALGVVRVTAPFSPDDQQFADAAFLAACASARGVADMIVAAAPTDDTVAAQRYREFGFEPGPDRVMLRPLTPPPAPQ